MQMKKADVIFIVSVLIILIPLILFLYFKPKGDRVIIKIDGKVIEELPLDKDYTKMYKSGYGYNTVEIKDSCVRVIDSSCPGRDCIHKGAINKNNEVIICLPHKFEVTVISEKEEYDVISE